MSGRFSQRSEILSKVLTFIDQKDWEDHGEYLIFGAEAFWGTEDNIDDIEKNDGDVISRWGRALRLQRGRKLKQEKTDLAADNSNKDEDPSAILDEYSDQTALIRFLETELKRRREQGEAHVERNELDDVDAFCASEIVKKIEDVVQRTYLLEQIEVNQAPNENVIEYFRAANECYILGLDIACAICCRALMESALKQKLGDGKPYDLLEKAKEKMLTDDRPHWASECYTAGNQAVHDGAKFKKKYPRERVQDILINTRKVVQQILEASVESDDLA